MKVALLSTENLDDFVCYDELLTTPLAELGWEVEVIPWRADENWNRFAAVIVRSPWDYQDEPKRFMQVLKEIDATSCQLVIFDMSTNTSSGSPMVNRYCHISF